LVAGLLFLNSFKLKNMILANSLATPAIGTIFWTTLIFAMFFILLRKFAWKPILNAVNARDEIIKGSLEAAEKAREDMKKLQADNETILRKAREERENILKDAREIRDKMINEAKGKAVDEAEKLIEKARQGIEREKDKALSEIHEQVAFLSVEIASKLIGEKLKETEQQNRLIENYLKEINLNKN
jgi:F-type H+-transporting ATPase subunit b